MYAGYIAERGYRQAGDIELRMTGHLNAFVLKPSPIGIVVDEASQGVTNRTQRTRRKNRFGIVSTNRIQRNVTHSFGSTSRLLSRTFFSLLRSPPNPQSSQTIRKSPRRQYQRSGAQG